MIVEKLDESILKHNTGVYPKDADGALRTTVRLLSRLDASATRLGSALIRNWRVKRKHNAGP